MQSSFFLINLLVLTTYACTSVPMLKINYNVPAKAASLAGRSVFLEIKDSRPDKDLFGEGAKEDFQNASESISLSVAEGNEKGFKVGLFSVTDLMQEIFKERLQSLGLEVETNRNRRGDIPTVVIDLETFKLDLDKGTVKRTWTGSMAYSAELYNNGKLVAASKISGSSEKMKIMRRKEADALMGDLVTELANRLDGQALFRQAGLI